MNVFWSFIKWHFGLAEAGKAQEMPYVPDYARPDMEKINHPDASKIQLTWVGHSTFLIQVAGMNILTDPIWSKRASPVQWAGPKRLSEPGVRFDHLPKIDLVLISHTHYDHLDRNTVLKLGNAPHYILPTRLTEWFKNEKITNVNELPWWQASRFGEIKITAMPAKHWSKRNMFGKEGHGWGGYMLETPVGTIYFAGDTGYHSEYFKEIGKRFPKIDLGLIPIGAYHPRPIFGNHHVDPHDAVVIHKEVGSKISVGMHWGAFRLTQESLDEPPRELALQVKAAGMPEQAFTAMKIGETRVF